MDPELKQCWTEVINQLKAIAMELQAIRSGQEAANSSSEALRQQAETALAAHRQQTEAYLGQVEFDPPPDFYPFVTLPIGTEIRDLPNDGNRIFLLADGMIIKTTNQKEFIVHDNGETKIVPPGPGAQVEIAPGRIFQLIPEWLELTMEVADIRGLPIDAVITQLTAKRINVEIAALRLVKDDQNRTLTIINPSGSVIYLSRETVETIGEEVVINFVSPEIKAFKCMESEHSGLIEADGTIHLTLKSGEDLAVSFPENGSQPSDNEPSETLCQHECEE